jgi:hypothetical protein
MLRFCQRHYPDFGIHLVNQRDFSFDEELTLFKEYITLSLLRNIYYASVIYIYSNRTLLNFCCQYGCQSTERSLMYYFLKYLFLYLYEFAKTVFYLYYRNIRLTYPFNNTYIFNLSTNFKFLFKRSYIRKIKFQLEY